MSFIPSSDFYAEVAKGNIPGHALKTIFGRNPAVQMAAEEDLWTPGGKLVFLTAADTLDLVSTSAADTAAGAGARSVTIEGLDTNLDPLFETIPLNGTTPVTTVNSFRRTLNAFVKTVGTYGVANTGAITITDTTGSSTQALIDAGQGVTQMSHYTIANAKRGFIINIFPSVETSKIATFITNRRDDADDVVAPFTGLRRGFTVGGAEGALPDLIVKPIELFGKTDFWFSATVTANNTQVHIFYQLLLVDDS